MCPSTSGPTQSPAKAKQTEIVNPSINPSEPRPTATVDLTDEAGGVAKSENGESQKSENQRLWHVVYVSPRSEKKVCKELQDAHHEAYIATRWEVHKWRNGQRKKIEMMMIHGVVFVKITHSETEDIRKFPLVYSFMMDPARKNSKEYVRSFAIIPDAEMRLLKAMLGQQDYDVDFATQFSVGEHVRIAGFEEYDDTAQIVKLPKDRSTYVGVRVSFLGCAYMKVPAARIIKIQSAPQN